MRLFVVMLVCVTVLFLLVLTGAILCDEQIVGLFLLMRVGILVFLSVLAGATLLLEARICACCNK